MAGSKAANLKRHLEHHHPPEFKAVCKADTEALELKKKAARNDGYKTIAEPIARHLGVSLQRDAVRALVITNAKAAKDILCNKAAFLKMDGAKRQRTSFVAVNTQFVLKNAIVMRKITVVDLEGQQTAASMKMMVERVT